MAHLCSSLTMVARRLLKRHLLKPRVADTPGHMLRPLHQEPVSNTWRRKWAKHIVRYFAIASATDAPGTVREVVQTPREARTVPLDDRQTLTRQRRCDPLAVVPRVESDRETPPRPIAY